MTCHLKHWIDCRNLRGRQLPTDPLAIRYICNQMPNHSSATRLPLVLVTNIIFLREDL